MRGFQDREPLVLCAIVTNLLAAGAVTAGKIELDSSVDSNGWQKISLSANVNAYFKQGSLSDTWAIQTWKQVEASAKPTALNTSNTFFGGAGGIAQDHAINVCGYINPTNATAQIQTQNLYNGGSVSSDYFWWAYIIEIVS